MKKRLITVLFIIITIIVIHMIIPKEVQAESFYSSDITWSWEYCSDGEYSKQGSKMAYGICIPSTASSSSSLPMIVWLCGSGSTAVSSTELRDNGLPGAVLNDWESSGYDGFSAYILCPQLQESNGYWNEDQNVKKLKALLDDIIVQYNIDSSNIVLMGNSRGGTGAMYIGNYLADYFTKCVVCSGFSVTTYPTIETICYVGTSDQQGCINAGHTYENVIGKDKVFWVNTSHGSVPYLAIFEDSGKFVRKRTEITAQT